MQTTGNSVLITGGATGIGLALAELLIEGGNQVVICGRREDKLAEARAKLPTVHAWQYDISIATQRVELINKMISEFNQFNVLINNAGIQQMLDFNSPVDAGKIAAEITTNLEAPMHLASLVSTHFSGKKESAIINVTSGLAFVPLAAVPVYCATKAALHSFSNSLRHQLKNTPIKVFQIAPPIVDTDLDKGARDKRGQTDKGITAMATALETLAALREDKLEFSIGMAQNLYNASRSDKAEFVFKNMNSH